DPDQRGDRGPAGSRGVQRPPGRRPVVRPGPPRPLAAASTGAGLCVVRLADDQQDPADSQAVTAARRVRWYDSLVTRRDPMPASYPGFDLFAQMQQLAAQYARGNAAPADIAAAWQRAMAAGIPGAGLGAAGGNPFADTLRAMRGQCMQGTDAWTDAIAPWLDAARREGSAWLGLPAFGLGREHQERLQALLQAQLEAQQREAEHNLLMLKAMQDAHVRFQRKLEARGEPGKQ